MEKKNLRSIYGLLFQSSRAVRIVNLITLYRIVTAPLLLVLGLTGHINLFKWLLLASFTTDAIDGYIARKYKATSVLGAKLDSIGDDLTVLVAMIILYKVHPDFIQQEIAVVMGLLVLFVIQLFFSFWKYQRPTSFHTYLAKVGALLQGIFLLSVFLLQTIFYWLFYAAVCITALELIEEILLIAILPKWRSNVKGLYRIFLERRKKRRLKSQ
jgi:phosphatidylglycerophosphate synthase